MTSRNPNGHTFCVEVCVDSVESAIAAINGGATRLELCGNLAIGGGTSPSLGLLRSVMKALPGVELMAMIRPRTGDFVYTIYELEVMLEDIEIFKEENITGVVFGVLLDNGTVDITTTRRLVVAAKPMQVCFHRAFDMTRDATEALKDVASIGGIDRVLTSGHGRSAPESLHTLSSIASLALMMKPPITILPGSGINTHTIRIIAECEWWQHFREVHLSAGNWLNGPMQFRKDGMGMGVGGAGEWGIWRSNAVVVRNVVQIVEEVLNNSR